jgi:very-short-patch-repair endonuclease
MNARVGGHEVDLYWRAEGLAVEVDGFAFHSSRAAFERDRSRDGDLGAAGVRVVRVTWRQLSDEPEAVVARLAGALRHQLASGS